MSVIFVAPPQHGLLEGFTSGLIALANYVAQQLPSVDVRISDLSRSRPPHMQASLRAVLDDVDEPVLIGITTTTATYQAALDVARTCKALAPGAMVVLGGHHSNTEDAVVLAHHPEIDAVIRGEGERAVVQLLKNGADFGSVPSLTFRSTSGIVRTADAPKLSTAELDELPIAFRGFDVHGPLGRCGHVTYVSARGCPLACSFCTVGGERIRARSIPRVVSDIRELVVDNGVTSIGIEDNFFAQSYERTHALCEALTRFRRAERADFTWDCQTRVESMARPGLAAELASAGCDAVFLGVENFDPEGLRYLNKTTRGEHYVDLLTRRVIPSILEAGMTCHINLQVGLPMEDQRQRHANLIGLERLSVVARRHRGRVVVCPMLHVVYPGTPLFQAALRSGVLARDAFEMFTTWERGALPMRHWLGRRFAHGTGGIPIGLLQPGSGTESRFVIDAERMATIDMYLDEIREMDGLETFDYSRFLVTDDSVGA